MLWYFSTFQQHDGSEYQQMIAQILLTFLALLALYMIWEALTKFIPHRGPNKHPGIRLMISVVILAGVVFCLDSIGSQGG